MTLDTKRFWSKVKRTEYGCWLWQSTTNSTGYGRFVQNGKYLRAHRVVWEMCYGPIPDGFVVMHRCDTPSCVKPEHLKLGSQAENMADMAAKGRGRNAGFQGSACGNSKLTEGAVRDIRAKYRKGAVGYGHFAKQYGVTRSAIYRVVKRLSWAHLS